MWSRKNLKDSGSILYCIEIWLWFRCCFYPTFFKLLISSSILFVKFISHFQKSLFILIIHFLDIGSPFYVLSCLPKLFQVLHAIMLHSFFHFSVPTFEWCRRFRDTVCIYFSVHWRENKKTTEQAHFACQCMKNIQ